MTLADLVLTDAFRTAFVLAVTAMLLVIALGYIVCAVRAWRDAAYSLRRIHQQQANIIAMMLRAGFRPARSSPDWFDDSHETSLRSEGTPHDTRVDAFAPWRPVHRQ